jgi:DNA-binding GntR family transcriptional regulator
LRITQEALANHLGISRVTVGAVLNKLASAGLVRLAYRKIYVPNPDALT